MALLKRQERILKEYFETAPDPPMTEYDKLPPKIRSALERVKNQETLWMDAERWLWGKTMEKIRLTDPLKWSWKNP